MTPQGWDRAEFRCGRCPYTVTTATEAEYLQRVQLHYGAHAAVDVMSDALRTEVLALVAPTARTHECRDCPKNGGIGFDCHHLIRGVRVADSCAWCRQHGYAPGQVIPGQEATRDT